MSLLKFMFASTAVGAVVITAPVVFVTGKMFGKLQERKQIREESEDAARTPGYMHKSEPTQWSKPESIDDAEPSDLPEKSLNKINN